MFCTDVDFAITSPPLSPVQGHYLLGIALHNLGNFKDALSSFLKTLDLDTDSQHMEVLTNNIATIASHLCEISDDLLNKIPGMWWMWQFYIYIFLKAVNKIIESLQLTLLITFCFPHAPDPRESYVTIISTTVT